jgi:hypothetical protein
MEHFFNSRCASSSVSCIFGKSWSSVDCEDEDEDDEDVEDEDKEDDVKEEEVDDEEEDNKEEELSLESFTSLLSGKEIYNNGGSGNKTLLCMFNLYKI